MRSRRREYWRETLSSRERRVVIARVLEVRAGAEPAKTRTEENLSRIESVGQPEPACRKQERGYGELAKGGLVDVVRSIGRVRGCKMLKIIGDEED